MTTRRYLAASLLASLVAVLTACGGGDSGTAAEADAHADADADAVAAAMEPMSAELVELDMAAAAVTRPLEWKTVANSATVIPGGDGRTFNSFNQPSVNGSGLVVLRGHSKGAKGAGEPLRGIYTRDMKAGRALAVAFDSSTQVPAPNNTTYQDALGTFTEFPAFPRISLEDSVVVTRAQSRPVWTYMLPDGTETRVGTSGLYTFQSGARRTAASQLGQVPGFEHFSVPGAAPGTRFDQFPGAPSMADARMVVFKGNYTDGVSKTGVFFRDTRDAAARVQVIANSDTLIPGQAEGGVHFGATAPPSALGRQAVFLGVDNEDSPSLGGIYLAPLAPLPALRTLASIGGQVPGEALGTGFTRVGEALSFGGQWVGFWGAWGPQTRSIVLTCPVDGQAAVIEYCNAQHPEGYAVEVPVNQGFFVHDLKSGVTLPVAKTGGEFLDFLYWTFSGRPPGVGGHDSGPESAESDGEDFEPPRWRVTTFAAAFSEKKMEGQVAFKARRAADTPVHGIYLGNIEMQKKLSSVTLTTVAETGMQGRLLDAAAPPNAVISAVGIEREGLRRGWLAISAAMLDASTSEGWAGVYVTRTRK